MMASLPASAANPPRNRLLRRRQPRTAMAATGEEQPQGPVLVLVLDKDQLADYSSLAADLRRAGVRAEMYLGSSGMKPRMKYADRRNSPAVVIVGGNEREKGVVTIKDLKALAPPPPRGMTDNDAWRSERPGQFSARAADGGAHKSHSRHAVILSTQATAALARVRVSAAFAQNRRRLCRRKLYLSSQARSCARGSAPLRMQAAKSIACAPI